jgi:hypothetical protein
MLAGGEEVEEFLADLVTGHRRPVVSPTFQGLSERRATLPLAQSAKRKDQGCA